MLNGASSATQPSYRDTSRMSISEKITTTISFGVTSVAKGAGGALGQFLKNPTNDAIFFGIAAIITGVQFVPRINDAVDITFCIVSAKMYASAELEHRENVGKGKQAKKLCDRDLLYDAASEAY